jgi:Cu(I)/Ag(I) efflux system membrane fusion protein
MDLVPVRAPSAAGSPEPQQKMEATAHEAPSTFWVSPERLQALGVEFGEALVQELNRELAAPAVVTIAEPMIRDINLKAAPGYVIKLYANYVGKFVRKGEVLATILAEGWVQAQIDYLRAYRAWRRSVLFPMNNPILLEQTFERVRNQIRVWDLSQEDLQALEKQAWRFSEPELETGHGFRPTLDLKSPINGHVHEKRVVEGQRFEAGQTLFRLADLSTVWVEAEFPEQEGRLLRPGERFTLTFPAFPEEKREARLDFLYPHLPETTRRFRARFVLSNPGHKLRPGMYAEARGEVPLGKRLTVPVSAVIPTGERFFVFVDRGGGHLQPVSVQVEGPFGDVYAVRQGRLRPGDRVVIGANYLVDAEARVQGALRSWARGQEELDSSRRNPGAASQEEKPEPMPGMPGMHMH